MTAVSPLQRLLAAQQRDLTHDQRIDTLSLTALRRRVPELPIAEAITSARVLLTIDGPCTLTLDVEDPLWLIERSGLLDRDADGRLEAIAVAVDKLRFRLFAARRRSAQVLTLEFEDEAKTLLEQHNKHKSWVRGTVTRDQAVGAMVAEVRARDLVYFAPQFGKTQPVARPDLPDARPHGTTGFDDGTTFEIKGDDADAQQMREVATALNVGDQLNITARPQLAMLVAGIGESGFRDVPNAGGSPYGGVFQALKSRGLSTAEQARSFLKGGNGFQGGGAIALARAHPDWSAGRIALTVEGSRSNFPSDADAEHFYQQHAPEARTIAGLWNSGTGASGDQVLTFKQYRFTRGLPGKKETSWQAGERLAREVNWRFYALGGVVCFVPDDYLITQAAWHTFQALNKADEWRLPQGLLEWPLYDWNHGKSAAQLTMRVVADAWSVIPGEVVRMDFPEPVGGRWIVESFEFDLLDVTEGEVTLVVPMPPRKEPAPQAITTSADGDVADAPAGARRAIAWAASKIGHYREEFGSNRGEELDALERGFGMQGQPWCAIFATTAAVEGGAPREARTASVAQIGEWCQAGSHGYQQGFRATPRPGDLMCFNLDTPQTGDDHVVFVEKVKGDVVHTIDGNPGAGVVQRGTRHIGDGKFVRPDYPN